MKKLLLITLLTTFLIPATGCADQIEQMEQMGQVSVSGQATQSVTPDEVVWFVSLNSTHEDLQKAKQDNDKKLRAVLAAADKITKEEKDIETGQLQVDRQYQWDQKDGTRRFTHFSVRRQVKIRQKDLDKFEDSLDRLIKSAEIELWFQYEISNEKELRHELKLEALDSAQLKAEAMVQRLGRKLGPALSISEFHPSGGGHFGGVPEMAMSAPMADGRSKQATPEARVLNETVYVVFNMR